VAKQEWFWDPTNNNRSHSHVFVFPFPSLFKSNSRGNPIPMGTPISTHTSTACWQSAHHALRSWKRISGRLRNMWLDQLQQDNNLSPGHQRSPSFDVDIIQRWYCRPTVTVDYDVMSTTTTKAIWPNDFQLFTLRFFLWVTVTQKGVKCLFNQNILAGFTY